MLKKIIAAGLLLALFGFHAAAQDAEKVAISGDLTTIYTLGNASKEQKIDDPTAVGAYFNSQSDKTRKNGYYTAANLYASLKPFPWIEGYFKVYAIHRPGSFYQPLQMENMGARAFDTAGGFTLDAVYGRASVFEAVKLDLPINLFLKGGKYKAQASQFGIISKYKTEQVLYMMNTKTDFTYELEIAMAEPVKWSLSAATNYLFNESVNRLYDEDGGIAKHGNEVLNEYAPQFLIGARVFDLYNASAEILYGQNVSNIYSGHAAGFSANYKLDLMDGSLSVPIGLQFAFHEKNIDMLGQAAVVPSASATITTIDFRNSLGGALGVGARYKAELFNIDFNVAGSFSNIKHIYRNDLNIIKLSMDGMFTFDTKYFIGGGVIFGTLADAKWETTDKAIKESGESFYSHTFTLKENIGYEVYGGVNLGNTSKFVIGFNQNKGISLNNMLEARHEGQMKYKQEGSSWSLDNLAEAGGLYFKFFFRF